MKLNVVLDLDNTLISTVDYNPSLESRYKCKRYDKDTLICARPYLTEFLEWLFDNCNVSVFTAADKDYAMFVINNFIGKRKLDFIFYRYHVNMGIQEFRGGLKDLRLIWETFDMYGFDCTNTLIIDDSTDVKATNPLNCMLLYPFNANKDFNDDHLLRVKKRLEYIVKNIDESSKDCIFKRFPEGETYIY
jgi:hypothetical protein